MAQVLVIVPTLGLRPHLLEEAMASLEQQVVSIRCIVVGPVVPSEDLMQASERRGFTLVKRTSPGLSSALNAGLQLAGPETFFYWLNDDDYILPGGLDSLVQSLAESSSSSVAFGACKYITSSGNVLAITKPSPSAARFLRIGPNLVPLPATLFRLERIRDAGGFDESLRYAMDLEINLRLSGPDSHVAVSDIVACHRWHHDTLTMNSRIDVLLEAWQIRNRYRNLFLKVFFWPWETTVFVAILIFSIQTSFRANRLR